MITPDLSPAEVQNPGNEDDAHYTEFLRDQKEPLDRISAREEQTDRECREEEELTDLP